MNIDNFDLFVYSVISEVRNIVMKKVQFLILNSVKYVQGDPTSFRWEVLVKISNLREIRIWKLFVKKIRQIEVRSALLS